MADINALAVDVRSQVAGRPVRVTAVEVDGVERSYNPPLTVKEVKVGDTVELLDDKGEVQYYISGLQWEVGNDSTQDVYNSDIGTVALTFEWSDEFRKAIDEKLV